MRQILDINIRYQTLDINHHHQEPYFCCLLETSRILGIGLHPQPCIRVCLTTHRSLFQTGGLNKLSTVLETSISGFKVILHHKEKSHTRDLEFWMHNVLMSFLLGPKCVVKQFTESCGFVRTPDCTNKMKKPHK